MSERFLVDSSELNTSNFWIDKGPYVKSLVHSGASSLRF